MIRPWKYRVVATLGMTFAVSWLAVAPPEARLRVGLRRHEPVQDGGSVYVISSDPDVAARSWQPGTGGAPGTGVHFGFAVS